MYRRLAPRIAAADIAKKSFTGSTPTKEGFQFCRSYQPGLAGGYGELHRRGLILKLTSKSCTDIRLAARAVRIDDGDMLRAFTARAIFCVPRGIAPTPSAPQLD